MSHVGNLLKNRIKEEINVEKIIIDIKNHIGHGTESNPEQYGDIFFNILKLSGVPSNDLHRYSQYAIGQLSSRIIKEVKNG